MPNNCYFRSILLLGIWLAGGLSGCNTQAPREEQPDVRVSGLQSGLPKRFAAALPPVKSAEDAVRRGDQAVRSGQQELAVLHYVQAVQLNPGDHESLYKIGVIHNSLGNESLAIAAFELALETNPRHAPSYENIGLLLLEQRQDGPAREYLERAVSIDAALWQGHNGLGILADLRGDYDEAAAHYLAAIEARPSSPKLVSNLGYSYYLQGNLAEAQAAFEQALRLDPQFHTGRQNLSLVHARRGEYSRALDLLIDNGNPAAAYNDLGYICILLGEYDRAREYLSEAIRISPSYYKKAEDNLMILEQRVREKRGPY